MFYKRIKWKCQYALAVTTSLVLVIGGCSTSHDNTQGRYISEHEAKKIIEQRIQEKEEREKRIENKEYLNLLINNPFHMFLR